MSNNFITNSALTKQSKADCVSEGHHNSLTDPAYDHHKEEQPKLQRVFALLDV